MNPPFNGWLEGLKFYGPVLLIGLVLFFGLRGYGYGWVGVAVFLLGFAMMLFFRDFPRTITAAAHEVVAPADGTITHVERLDDTPHYDGSCIRISTFLSVFSVHVNRAPFEGTVTRIVYFPGKFLDARKDESAEVNEANAVWLDTPRGPMTVRQITGAVARRIVCPATVGTKLEKGEKYGMIRFGSRTDLYLPPNAVVAVAVGDKVNAGLSIMARFEED